VVSRRRPGLSAIELQVAAGATLEWLPQETIVFSAAQAELSTAIDLKAMPGCSTGTWSPWAARPVVSVSTSDTFRRNWISAAMASCSGTNASALSGLTVCSTHRLAWTGKPVFATLLVTGEIDSELLERCRSLPHAARGSDAIAGAVGRPVPGQRSAAGPRLAD
jgi:urease accessory protein